MIYDWLSISDDVLGGEAVFAGTRVPISALFDNIADGLSLDEILDSYPTISRAQALQAIAALPHIKHGL